jgi:argininosuccinate lyase
MGSAEFDAARMAERAAQNWITVTELADTLARDHGLPFRAGHTIAARLIAGASAPPGRPLAATLREISREVTGREIAYTDVELARILSPRHFVEVRKTHGGPSPSEMSRAIGVSKKSLAGDEEWLAERRESLRVAGERLRAASRDL